MKGNLDGAEKGAGGAVRLERRSPVLMIVYTDLFIITLKSECCYKVITTVLTVECQVFINKHLSAHLSRLFLKLCYI
jgi:hypothetical protein